MGSPGFPHVGFPVRRMRTPTDSRVPWRGHSALMTVKLDVSEVGTRLQALHEAARHRAPGSHECVAVVVPLAEGRSDVVREFLAEGPPFDPAEVGLQTHTVFLTEREAIFVFDTIEGAQAFERILAEPEFWGVVPAWEHNVAEEPRVGAVVYEWRDSQS